MSVIDASKRYLTIDDLCDTGDTYNRVAHALTVFNCGFCFCVSSYKSPRVTAKVFDDNKWIMFLWE